MHDLEPDAASPARLIDELHWQCGTLDVRGAEPIGLVDEVDLPLDTRVVHESDHPRVWRHVVHVRQAEIPEEVVLRRALPLLCSPRKSMSLLVNGAWRASAGSTDAYRSAQGTCS